MSAASSDGLARFRQLHWFRSRVLSLPHYPFNWYEKCAVAFAYYCDRRCLIPSTCSECSMLQGCRSVARCSSGPSICTAASSPVAPNAAAFAARKRLRDAVAPGECVFHRLPQPARFTRHSFPRSGQFARSSHIAAAAPGRRKPLPAPGGDRAASPAEGSGGAVCQEQASDRRGGQVRELA